MAIELHCFISHPVPGKGHMNAIYRALGRSELFLKTASTLHNENTLAKRGRVYKAISCANPPPRSLDAMADSRCTGQTVWFPHSSPFIFPFIEIQSIIVREQAYVFIYAFPTLLIKETEFFLSPAHYSLYRQEAVDPSRIRQSQAIARWQLFFFLPVKPFSFSQFGMSPWNALEL